VLGRLSVLRPSLISTKKPPLSLSATSLCAAFPKPNGKSSPLLQLANHIIHATTANSRPGFFLQTRPLSGENILGIFKNDAQKKNDKVPEESKVHLSQYFQLEEG
jgi:hypothetical protein